MAYRPTGRPNGRPRKHPRVDPVFHSLRRAAELDRQAAVHRARAAACLARELADGKTRAQLAAELGWLRTDLKRALRAAPVKHEPKDRSAHE
jgi:hypothetical protein